MIEAVFFEMQIIAYVGNTNKTARFVFFEILNFVTFRYDGCPRTWEPSVTKGSPELGNPSVMKDSPELGNQCMCSFILKRERVLGSGRLDPDVH